MMFSRTALRLAIIEALAPHALNSAAAPVWPTFAGSQVYDSQMQPIALAEADPRLPIIVVFTDETALKADGTDVALDSSATTQVVTLAFEIAVPVATVDGKPEVSATDAAAEALLDMIEEQIRQRIDDARMNGPLRLVLNKILEVESQPYRDADTEIRLSARRLELSCSVFRGRRWPAKLPNDAPPFDYLPFPLADVARELPPGGYAHKIATMLGGLIGRPADFPALNELRLAANLKRGAGDAPPPPADAGQTPPVGDVGGRVIF